MRTPGKHILNHAGFHADLQGIVESVKKTAQRGAQGQFDDLFFTEMLFQSIEDVVTQSV